MSQLRRPERPPRSIGPPQSQVQPQSTSARLNGGPPSSTSLASATASAAAKSKVGMIMKKRYSTRAPSSAVTMASELGAAGHATAATRLQRGGPQQREREASDGRSAVRTQLNDGRAGGGGGGSGVSDERLRFHEQDDLDLDAFSDSKFDAERYLKVALSGASPSTLRVFQEKLLASQTTTAGDLQKNVFRNYQEFVTISKEIATLEEDMLEMKSMLREWENGVGALGGDEGRFDFASEVNGNGNSSASAGMGGTGPSRMDTRRSSIQDLQAIRRTQIQTLWEMVEGSQKFLSATGGGHVIHETGAFIELNAATYKARQSVHFILLNTALMIAIKKHRQANGSTKLVAERCHALGEIVVVDLRDSGALTNAIKIRKGKESFIYRTDAPVEKRKLLAAFKRVAEEMSSRKRNAMIKEAEARRRGSVDEDFGALSILDKEEGGRAGGRSLAGTKHKDETWINDYGDELDVVIAIREWEEAVRLIEKSRVLGKNLDPVKDANAIERLKGKTDERTQALSQAMLVDLNDPFIKKGAVLKIVALLTRLGQSHTESARDVFLNARGLLIKRRLRQIRFEGECTSYISELTQVFFTLIWNTSQWYLLSFKDNKMASGFVDWARKQVEFYADLFQRQVQADHQDPKVVRDCHAIARQHANTLCEVGLDFRFLLNKLLHIESREKIEDSFSDTNSVTSAPGTAASSLPARPQRRQGPPMHLNGSNTMTPPGALAMDNSSDLT